ARRLQLRVGARSRRRTCDRRYREDAPERGAASPRHAHHQSCASSRNGARDRAQGGCAAMTMATHTPRTASAPHGAASMTKGLVVTIIGAVCGGLAAYALAPWNNDTRDSAAAFVTGSREGRASLPSA